MHNTLLERAKEIQTEGQQAQEEQDGRSGLLDDWDERAKHLMAISMCFFFMFGVWMKWMDNDDFHSWHFSLEVCVSDITSTPNIHLNIPAALQSGKV